MTDSKELAVKSATELLASIDMEGVPTGFEGATADSFVVERIRLLQASSPSVKKSHADYIKGAEEGSFISSTGDILGESFNFVPVKYEMTFVEIAPKGDGTGDFVATHPSQSPLVAQIEWVTDDKGKSSPTIPNGNELYETHTFYIIVVSDDGFHEPAVLSMSKTARHSAKAFMTLARKQRVLRDGRPQIKPLFANIYTATSVGKSKGNNTWVVPQVTLASGVEDAGLLSMAIEMSKMGKSDMDIVSE